MQTKLFNKHQLQNKLTFYPLFWFAIGLLVTFFSTAVLIKIYLDNYLMNQTVAYTQQIAKDIDNIIQQDKETIAALVLSDTMRDLSREDRLTIVLERFLNKNRNFLEGYIINQEGQTIAGVSLIKIFLKQYPNFKTQYIYQLARAGKIGVSGWENFTEKYRPYWYMAVPIEKYPGAVIGVLIVTIDLHRINDAILTSKGARYGKPILIDRHANVLVHLDQSRLGKHWDIAGIAQKLTQGQIGTATYHDPKGKYVLAAYQPLDPYGWGLIVQIPPDQTIYLIRNKVITLFGLMTIVIFIITGMVTYFAAGKIVSPIRKLTNAALKFGKGHQVEYLPVDGEDEIAELSAAFYDMELRLTDFEKQRALYISMIAHDLKNPLFFIKDAFPLLQNENFNEQDKAKNLSLIKLRLEQVNRMIADLLEFSRLDLGQVSFKLETVSVRYLCQDIIAGYFEQRNKFILKHFPETFCVWADPVRLQQIIQNIFDNCLKYTPADSGVSIDCRADKEQIQIEIADNGNGIPDEILGNLFRPFQTTDLLKKDSYGLGMAIAKKLAVGMDGDLIVESIRNKGTTFRIKLPIRNER